MTDEQSAIGRRSKRKGKAYEARVAKLWSDFTGENFRRVPSSGGFNKFGGLVVATQIFTGDVFSNNPNFIFSVEAKNRQDISLTALLKNPPTATITSYWYQCVEDARNNKKKPIMFFKPNMYDDWICLDYNDLEFLGLSNSIRMDFKLYGDETILTVINRNERGKKTSKERKSVKLPNFSIMDWKEFIKHVKPANLFENT